MLSLKGPVVLVLVGTLLKKKKKKICEGLVFA